MQQLSELLTRLQIESGFDSEPMSQQEFEQWKADKYNASVGNLNEIDGYNCDLCKNRGDTATVVKNEQFGYYNETLVPCKCMRIRAAIHRLNRSGLKNIVKDYTFAKYECPDEWQKKIKTAAEAFCKDEENGLYIQLHKGG